MHAALRSTLAVAVGLGVGLAALDADATYSVAAVDRDGTLVGGAGTSCVGTLSVSVIQGLVPGIGTVHAQAFLNEAARDEAVRLLEEGATPDEVIAAITASSFDAAAAQRQYGVVTLDGQSAGFTGAQNGVFAGDRQGTDGAFVYSVQGNILTGQAVIDQAEAGFLDPAACDLAERLMRSLEEGAVNGQGDTRCTPGGIPADSAFVRVMDASGQDLVFLDVTNTSPNDPVEALRAQFDLWRVDNACPVGDGDGDGDGDGGEGTSGATEATGGTVDGGADAGTGTGVGEDDGAGGCACAMRDAGERAPPGWAALVLVAGAAASRRRRRRARVTAD